MIEIAAEITQALKKLTQQRFFDQLPRILDYSDFIKRTLTSYPKQILELIESKDLEQIYTDDYLFTKVQQSTQRLADQTEFEQRLRQIRHVEMSRIVLREFAGVADIEESMRDLSLLADALLSISTERHLANLKERYGQPIGETNGQEAGFVVFAMGKLGGNELNFSSDIDLIFAYSDSGQTNGNRSISNNEFFMKLGQALINSLNHPTTEGIVYRVDMRLRPNGQSGPLAMSFAAMENYYQIHGREWERYAWIKARVVAGDQLLGEHFLRQLRPFIYRKYLDYQVYESLEEMKAMINKEILQQGMQQNIKLGRGGIREIEFIAQSHQLVRGGREAELRTRSLKQALSSLAKGHKIETEISNQLYRAYLFLRTVEHRLQIKNDQQTHLLPDDLDQRRNIATTMSLSLEDFEQKLNHHRDFVHAEFVKLHSNSEVELIDDNWQLLWRGVVADNDQLDQLSTDKDFINALKSYAKSKAYRSLESKGRRIVDRLMPKVLELVVDNEQSQQTLNRILTVLSAIGGRSAYLSLLDQFPVAAKQLIQLCALSSWVSQWIADHPIVLDTLINPRVDLYIFNNELEQDIFRRIENETDDELKHDILRQIHHSSLLQIAIADLQHQYDAQQIRTFISRTAEMIVNHVVILCQQELTEKYGLPQTKSNTDYFGVIAYGKLGSRELTYNADLDLVFIYDDEILEEQTQGGKKSVRIDYYFSRLVQRILTMLTMQTAAGKLYEVDTRLRPSGRSGLLVSSLTQYAKYQNEQAWTWEHQALVKARMMSKAHGLAKRFDQLRTRVLSGKRSESELKRDIVSMRKRMHAAEQHKNNFRQKTDAGGMIDIEFITQFLVLNYAHRYEDITQKRSVKEIIEFAISKQLLQQEEAELLSNSYVGLLQLENQYKLHNKINNRTKSSLGLQMKQVEKLWNRVFK